MLGDSDGSDAASPRQRMLQGRVAERWLLYPIYVLVLISAGLSIDYAIFNPEWAVGPTVAAWGMLFTWYWFYGVAYRYRRRVLKYFSVTVLIVLTWCLSLLCFDRARPQVAAVADVLVERPNIASLYWAGVLTIVAVSLLAVHVLVLGRGYRQKKA